MGVALVEHSFGHRAGGGDSFFVVAQFLHNAEAVHRAEVGDVGQTLGFQAFAEFLNVAVADFRINAQQVEVVGTVSIGSIRFFYFKFTFLKDGQKHDCCT